ncbi:MAG: DEAD/DEAH box helicase [Firmicutes bacterium]|nr:DEAD/DEAH box helicase [Bacillota bacterium]
MLKRVKLKNDIKTEAKLKAFDYQKEAFETVKDLEYAAIFHEQGLGKTKIAIDLLLYWLKETSIDTVLIVTKKQLVNNWKNEFETHTFIKPTILSNDKANNYYAFTSPSRVIITNFESLQTERQQFELYLKTRYVAIIIDESAKLKNPKSNLTQTFLELAPLFKKRVIMTGTPVANRPYDIWSQIYFLDSGKSLGTDFNDFKDSTDLSNDLAENECLQNDFELSLAGIYAKIQSFSVRETKNSGIIVLPNKIYIRHELDLYDEQFQLYEKIRNELRVEAFKGGKRWVDDSSAVVKRLLRLSQITSNPMLIDDSYNGKSAKEKVLDELISDILSKGEKCIVWTNYIENVDNLHNKYKNLGSVKIHGSMKIDDRNKSVEKFRLPDYKILFATPASAKEGLTLTQANNVIFYDRGFSLDDYLQAQDRIHRISQKKICYVHNLIALNTIDEWIDILLSAKAKAAALAQGDITIEEYREIADYSFGEIVKEILNTSEDNIYG